MKAVKNWCTILTQWLERNLIVPPAICWFSFSRPKSLLSDLNLKSSGLDSLIKLTYDTLGLKTFFTVGKDECRAWTFKDGMSAEECAGLIHTDLQRGFIKAEIYHYDDIIKYQDEQKVKEAGKLRIEGRDYKMQDGDIVYIRFSV